MSSNNSVPQAKQPFNYKAQSSIGESIQEDYMMSADRRSKRSPGGESSIAEESNIQSASRMSSSHKKKHSSIIEESLEGDYSEEKFDSY